jgi:serine/threonine-protein kinase
VIRDGVYVHPATHSTDATSGPDTAPPYGAHLRLRADYPLDTLPNEASRTVARALQTYGMYLADGGNIALTARSDRSTTAKWADLMESRDMEAIRPADFELMPLDTLVPLTYDCVLQAEAYTRFSALRRIGTAAEPAATAVWLVRSNTVLNGKVLWANGGI